MPRIAPERPSGSGGIGAAICQRLAADGLHVIVHANSRPAEAERIAAAGDRVEDNLNPVGRAYYGFSTLLCTPASLSQPVGAALGTQAGPARIRAVVEEAGFTRFRLAAQTPFNNVYEVRG